MTARSPRIPFWRFSAALLVGALLFASLPSGALATSGDRAPRRIAAEVGIAVGNTVAIVTEPGRSTNADRTLPVEITDAIDALARSADLGRATLEAQGYEGLWFIRFEGELPITVRTRLIADLHALSSVRFASEVRTNGAAFDLPTFVPLVPKPELLLVLERDVALAPLEERLAGHGLTLVRTYFATTPILLVSHDAPGTESAALADALARWEGVASAEVNWIEHMEPFSIPNDPHFGGQWALQNTPQNPAWTGGADLNAPLAWDLTTGNSGVTIAVIDEGVDVTHPDLAPRLGTGYDATDQPSPGGIAGNCLPDDEHGTACAGIAAAAGNNGIGITGVCWNATILPVRIGYGTHWSEVAWQVDALLWATNQGADVLSNSWGSTIPSASIQTTIQFALSNGRGGLGCVVVFAAGNTNGPIVYPAKYPETITVGATSPCDERTSPTSCDGETFWGSCFGLELDLVAPGVKLRTTDIVGPTGRDPGDYILEFNGTSAACPFVAGGAALLLSLRPDLNASQVRAMLTSACDDQVGAPLEDVAGWDQYMGWGRLDLRTLLEFATAPDPVDAIDCVSNGDSVSLNWTATALYDSIEVSRDGTLLATLPGSATTHTENAVPPGSHRYEVIGVLAGARSPRAVCSAFILNGATDLVWSPPNAGGGIDGGASIAAALLANGKAVVTVEDISAGGDLDLFERIWVNLGISPGNHVLTQAEASLLETYLTNGVGGASLYLEGGDAWAFDPQTTLQPLFNIDGFFDGVSDLDTITGFDVGSADLSMVSMPYGGENSFIDELAPITPAVTLLRNGPFAVYDVAIYHEAASYRTVGASFEFGGLFNTASVTRNDVMAGLIDALTIPRTPFMRGDANGNGIVNLADVVLMLSYLFNGATVNCLDAIDTNDNGSLNLADAVFTLQYLFSGGTAPAAPFPTVDVDPTDLDPLDCASYP